MRDIFQNLFKANTIIWISITYEEYAVYSNNVQHREYNNKFLHKQDNISSKILQSYYGTIVYIRYFNNYFYKFI